MLYRHEHDDDRRRPGDRGPIDRLRQPAAFLVPGQEHHRLVGVAMRHRNAGIGEPAEPRRNPRHEAEFYPLAPKRQRLLGAAPEEQRVAALEPQHALARLGLRDQPEGDVGLLRRRLAAAFARMHQNRRGRSEFQ